MNNDVGFYFFLEASRCYCRSAGTVLFCPLQYINIGVHKFFGNVQTISVSILPMRQTPQRADIFTCSENLEVAMLSSFPTCSDDIL